MQDYPTALQLLHRAERRQENHPWDLRSATYRDAEAAIVAAVTGGARNALVWVSTLHRYEQFWREEGRSPRENTRNRQALPAPERRLGEWARYQRRYRDGLCRYQVVRLEVSPAFEWDPQEASWLANLAACDRHRRRTGALPHLSRTDAVEFALARWLNHQLKHLRMGTLSRNRERALLALLATGRLGPV